MSDSRTRSYHAERDGLRELVGRISWTHFVTLTFSDQTLGVDWMRNRLWHWDQRVNRRMLGSAYRRKPHERLHWIACPEKIGSNPHWHLVLELTEEQMARETEGDERAFRRAAPAAWEMLVPRGTIDIQEVESDGVNAYITKAASSAVNLENFVHSRQVMKL